MSSEGKEENSLLCSACKQQRPKVDFSGKQLKLKGKRKCKECAVEAAAAPAPAAAAAAPVEEKKEEQEGDVLRGSFFTDVKGKQAVKAVPAYVVEKANKELVKQGDDDKYTVFLNWLKKGGAKYPHLSLKFYTVDYRGVHAKKRLENNELILEVPLNMIITSDLAEASDIGTKIRKSGCELRSDHSWLAAYLLQEKYNPDSFWKPYIDTLPVHYRNMPIFFDEDELKWLKGSFTLKMISDRKLSLKAEYDNICSFVPEFKKYHHYDFFWGRLAVITRIFGFEIKGRKTDGLVPMADMLNHKTPNETTWTFDDSRNGFTITTTKRLLKGSQIYDSYGRKCNSRFFVNYGFSLDFNEDNQAAMYFTLPKDDPLYSVKAKIIGGNRRRFQIPFEHKEKVTRKCMSFLRVMHATAEELEKLAKLDALDKIDPISAANEAKVVQTVAEQAAVVLKGFDTTVAQDNKILEDPEKKLTMNIRNCIIMRRGEKEVLEAYVDLWEHVQKIQSLDSRELRLYLARHIRGLGKEPDIAWRRENWFDEIWMPALTGEKVEFEEMDNSLEAD